MSQPTSFTTQSLGELLLLDGSQSYRPSNQNENRFLFEPSNNSDSSTWITLIDQRAPQLNSQWPAILASAPDKLTAALSDIGQSALSDEANIQHITLNGQGEALLLISLSKSEEGHALEVALDDQGQVSSINPTR